MYVLRLGLMMLGAYLLGSVNFAVVAARLLGGGEIRDRGSGNPGAANVFRELGRGWGLLVGVLDALKSFLPILLGRLWLFPRDTYGDFWALFLIGLAAVTGHIKPVFHRFRGGGGLSTTLGLFVFFLPFEYLLSLLLGGLIVIRFFKGMKYKFGRWTPIMSVVICPLLTLGLNYLVRVPLFAHVSIGGHPWYMLVGAFGVSLYMLGMNVPFLLERLAEQRAGAKPKAARADPS